MEFRSQGDPLGYNDIEVVYVQDIFKMLLAKVNQEVVWHFKNTMLKKKEEEKEREEKNRQKQTKSQKL